MMLKDTVTLDSEQRRVVDHGPGPLCALGGPGTGKTTSLEERYVRLALNADSSPDRILFLVPNRAQKIELVNRLTRRLLFDEGLDALVNVPVYTWHGLAYHLVTRHYRQLGYPEPPVLLTSPEQWGDIKDALAGESDVNWPNYKSLLRTPAFVDEVVDFCIRAQQRVMDEKDLAQLVDANPQSDEIARFYRKHRTRLRSGSRVDYPTLMQDAVSLISEYENIRFGLQQHYRHILVDDGQDLPLVQQKLLEFLSGFPEPYEPYRSLVVAADPDSAIETFRGAEPSWLEHFTTIFGGGEIVTLETSYRLGPEAGAKAREFIELTGPGPHRTSAFAGGATVEARCFPSLAAEAEAVARVLRHAHLSEGVAYRDMAILLTSPATMIPALERALNAVEVPFSISVPDRPLEGEPIVRAFRSLARFAFRDDEDELFELLRSPLAGFEDHEIRSIERAARMRDLTVGQILFELDAELDDSTRARARELLRLVHVLKARATERADEAFWAIWQEAGYYRELERRAKADTLDPAHRELERRAKADTLDPAHRELDALVAFSRALGRFVERRRGRATLDEYLEAISRADFGADPWLPPQRTRDGVQVLSFHAAKGKQWSVVAVCGCVEGAIPKGRRARGLFDPYFLDEDSPVARARRNEAEDRRVFFVATTRATKRCLVTSSPGPSRRGQPSRFVAELIGEQPEIERASELPPLTFSEAAARMRRVLADASAPRPDRIAALGSLGRIRELDPGCAAARPQEWWWRWDWTEGALPIQTQAHRADDDVGKGKLRTSYSRISQYDNCGLAYLCSVVLGLDPDRSHNMAFGTWMHQIFEDCEKEPTSEQAATGRRRLTNLPMALERFEDVFDPSVFPNRAVARQFHRDGVTMLERYSRYLKPGQSALAEHSFEVDFRGHRIKGRIDRVDKIGRGVVVSDYKTSRNPLFYTDAKESLQLAIYYLAARSDEKIAQFGNPVSMQLVYPADMSYGKPTVRAQTPEEAEAALERLPALIEGVLAEDFRPSPEADCKWCKFKPLCPLWAEGKELPA